MGHVGAGFLNVLDPVELGSSASSQIGKLRKDVPDPVARFAAFFEFTQCALIVSVLRLNESFKRFHESIRQEFSYSNQLGSGPVDFPGMA